MARVSINIYACLHVHASQTTGVETLRVTKEQLHSTVSALRQGLLTDSQLASRADASNRITVAQGALAEVAVQMQACTAALAAEDTSMEKLMGRLAKLRDEKDRADKTLAAEDKDITTGGVAAQAETYAVLCQLHDWTPTAMTANRVDLVSPPVRAVYTCGGYVRNPRSNGAWVSIIPSGCLSKLIRIECYHIWPRY